MRPSFDFIVLSPPGTPDPRLPIAAARAGALGVLDLEFCADPAAGAAALRRLEEQGRGRHGVLADDRFLGHLLEAFERLPDAVLLARAAPERLEPLVAKIRERGARAFVVATTLQEAAAAEAAGADAVVAKGHEAGGWIGDTSAFVLLQQLCSQLSLPVWAHGGVGLHTAAACYAAGAAGAILDAQVLLARESPLADPVRARIAALDGSETVALGAELGDAFRIYSRPDLEPVARLRETEARLIRDDGDTGGWRDAVAAAADWRRLDESVLALGQDACFAAGLARRFRTVGGILEGLRNAIVDQCRSARSRNPLAEGAPLAASHGTRFPIVQGPMTRVSDRAEFAAAVADAGGLPLLALALMRAAEAKPLLAGTQRLLGERPWGVGILGFVPAALREEQIEAIREYRPPYALIAGGRPDQARALEDEGIATYLHVPSPGLLDLYLRDGARRFVFEGRECGGHVGPRTSFVLWDTMVRRLLEALPAGAEPSEYHVLLAGGIHDALSAAMAAAVLAPLVERGMRVGCLVGTGYLFCEEAVGAGAITAGFQRAALDCDRTVFLESGPGHATRCLPSPFAEEFAAERGRLVAAGLPSAEVREALEVLNIGRLRIASKGVERNLEHERDPDAPRLVAIEPDDQWARGMYMIGQVAALRDRVQTVADLHRDIAEGSGARLAAAAVPEVEIVREPSLPPVDVAIVGMGCILPGAPDLETFWANIVEGVDAVTEVPADRFDWRQYFDADRAARDKIYSRWGGFIPDVPFDPVAFGMPPNSLRSIDPFQLLGLLTARAALDDAGYGERPFARERTSVILGAGGGGAALGVGYTARSSLPALFGDAAPELVDALDGVLPEWTEDSFPGLLMNVAAGRIANRLDLGGANYTVDAACASALAAVSLGARDLRSGAADMAIVGGVDAIQTAFAYLCFSKTHALSPSGRCRPFDADADGIAISEGFAAVVLKRLEDAERDGDRVYCVVRGVGTASDGRDRSLTAPRPEGQMRALRRAYANAGFSPATVGLVEAHGTGTVAGDGAEAKALSTVFTEAGADRQECAIGSVKSMIGHTKATAGVAGLIKAALALHHRVLPPTIGVTRPNPKAGFESSPFYVNTETRPWIQGARDHPRRAAVSSFGFGGTNFHAVLEEYTGDFLDDEATTPARWPAELFAFRGASRGDVQGAVEEVLSQLESGARPAPADLAHTLALQAGKTRPGGPALAVVADSVDVLIERLREARQALAGGSEREHSAAGVHFAATPLADRDGVAFLFPGQGSQSTGMGRDVAVAFPEVAACFDRADRTLATCFDRPLSRYVFPPPVFDDGEASRLQAELTDTHIAQPALGATDLAYLTLLRSFGVEPGMVAGHSYGEFVALAAAGSLTEADLLRLSEARGRFIREGVTDESGCMAAVGAPPDRLRELLSDELVIANLNAPDQTVLSGSRASVERAVEWCRERKLSARLVPVACAFHSRYVSAAQQRLAEQLGATAIAAPRIPVFSNSTGARYPDEPAAIAALLGDHLISPVDFVRELEGMYAAGGRIFVEVGPRNVLSGLARKTLGDRPHVCLAVDQPGRHGIVQLLHCLAALVAEGAPVDLMRMFRGRSPVTLTLRELAADASAARSPSTWIVNGARARPAGSPVATPDPVRVALVDDAQIQQMTTPQQGMVQVTPSSAVSTNGVGEQPATVAPPAAPPLPARLPPAAVDPGPPAGGDRVADVMSRYQHVMQHFLDTERSVMLAYLTQGRPIGSAPAGPVIDSRASVPPPAAVAPPSPAPPVVQAPPVTEPVVVAQGPPAETATPPSNGHRPLEVTREQLTAQLLEVVSERTGYPTDMLDLDVDLEADLSIDSIKRVEIAGTIVESLPLPEGVTLDAELMSASRTLRQVIEVLEALVRGEPPPGAPAPASDPPAAAMPVGDPPDGPATVEEGDRRPFAPEPADARIGRFVLRAVPSPPLGDVAGLAPAGTVMLVGDATGVGEALAERLRGAGHDVVRLAPGTDPEALRSAARELAQRNDGVKALVHLGALDASASADANLLGLFVLAQALRDQLERAAANGGAAVLAATRMGGTFAVDGDVPADAAAQGMLAGFLKTLALEWPAVRVKAVDLGPSDAADAQAAALAAELTAADGRVEIGYRDGERFVLEPAAAPAGDRPESEPLDGGSVLLVTGGARGITAAAALALARRYRPTVVLVGRTELREEDPELAGIRDERALLQAVLARMRAANPAVAPAEVEAELRRVLREREVRETLAQLREWAAGVDYRRCDVRDATAFAALVDDVYATYGRIDGAIHGAGVIEDKLVADKDLASFERVVETKVGGATVLADKLRPDGLRFLVLFSSVSGRFGNRGQADYAAASEALNKLAQQLDRRWPARVVSINWGPWLTTGMVSEQVRRQFAERGVELIPVETGCRMLDEELRRGHKGEPEVVIGGTRDAPPAGAHALLAVSSRLNRSGDGRLEVDRRFDLRHDLYLSDHRLDGRPVVPFAVATELMAEVAAAASPELEVTELSGIRLLHGITVDEAGVGVRIVAEPAGANEIDVTVVAPDSPDRPLYRARARSGDLPAPIGPQPLPDLAPFPMAVEQAYAAYLFHGPLFQNIVAIGGMDARGASAVVRPCPPGRCLSGVEGRRWWMDPIAFDSALQLQVLWARINWGITLLPAEIGAVRALAPLTGDAIRLELRIRPESKPPLCHADHYFLALDGRVLATLTDVVGTGSKALNRLAGTDPSGSLDPAGDTGVATR